MTQILQSTAWPCGWSVGRSVGPLVGLGVSTLVIGGTLYGTRHGPSKWVGQTNTNTGICMYIGAHIAQCRFWSSDTQLTLNAARGALLLGGFNSPGRYGTCMCMYV